jgi:hypothetical protein
MALRACPLGVPAAPRSLSEGDPLAGAPRGDENALGTIDTRDPV